VVHRNPFDVARLARGASGLAGALRADPRQQASKFMLDVALRRFLVYTAILLAVLAYIGWRVAEFSTPGARVLAGVAALAPLGFAATFLARLDDSLRAYLKAVVTQGRQRVAAIAAAICVVLLLLATVAPAAWLPGLLGGAAIGGFGVRLLTVSESNAHVRAAGVDLGRDRVTHLLWWLVAGCLVAGAALELTLVPAHGWLSLVVLLLAAVAVAGLVVIVRRRRARR
jgi:hypothetical protein